MHIPPDSSPDRSIHLSSSPTTTAESRRGQLCQSIWKLGTRRFRGLRFGVGCAGVITALWIGAADSAGQETVKPTHPELKYQTWSGKVNVPDPVALSVANDGTVYVTQTQRRKIQDLDIRANSDWIPYDVGFSSVAQKLAFYRTQLAIGGDQAEAARHVEDVNQDGQHDWRDLTVISEKIHRLADTDGDGKADRTNVFAEGFQTEVTGIAAGVLHHDGKVYATIAPDVWRLEDTTGDHVADQRSIVATGFGLHIAYAGHDMHGLMIGPDGKLYWSIGDKGISVTTADGEKFLYPNQGGVLRCNLDGSDFEVFAHGLRNVQEFAFDSFGNIFGVDNDSDQPGERERFVWIVDQMDAGWRCNYQYRSGAYNPWTDEKLWETAGPEHPAYIVPPISYFIDGPAGFKFNPGAALSHAYKDYFFMTGAPNGGQYAFRTEPDGDSFRMVDDHKIGEGVAIVGIAFGPDGGLYGADWGGGYPLTQTGSVQRIDVAPESLTEQEKSDRASVMKWLNQDLETVSSDQLVSLLSHVDQRVRLRAQFALVNRGDAQPLLKIAEHQSANLLARVHAIWGVGQLLRPHKSASANLSFDALRSLLKDPSDKIRLVATKVLGESNHRSPQDFVSLLSDPDLHVRISAALALGRCPTKDALEPLLDQADQTTMDQHYLRHAIATALTTCATSDELVSKPKGRSELARLCAVVALRRQQSPLVKAYLDDPRELVATEAARAIHDDFSIGDALVDLAAVLDHPSMHSEALIRRAINANLRLGSTVHASRLLKFAANEDQPESMRAEACDAIAAWMSPPVLDRVDGRHRQVAEREPIERTELGDVLVKLIQDAPATVRVAAAKAAGEMNVTLSAGAMEALANDSASPTGLRLEAVQMIGNADSVRLDSDEKTRLLAALSVDREASIAGLALRLYAKAAPQKALPLLQERLQDGKRSVQQIAIEEIASLGTDDADQVLSKLGNRLRDGELETGLSLDVYNALMRRSSMSAHLASLLDQVNKIESLASLQTTKHRQFALARDGGDVATGERIFRTDLRAQCSRCHRIGKSGSNIGPELSKIAKKRDADYLLRAVVYPSADIEAKYNVQTVLLADGNVVQGVLKSEDDDFLVLLDANGKELKLPQEEIEQVAEKKVSLMPDMTAVLSADEVRDLVAYLRSLR